MATKAELDTKVEILEEENKFLKESLALAEKAMVGMSDTIGLLRKDLDAAAAVPPGTDSVTFGGKTYPIVHQSSVKELHLDRLRGYVDENLTAVVINRVH